MRDSKELGNNLYFKKISGRYLRRSDFGENVRFPAGFLTFGFLATINKLIILSPNHPFRNSALQEFFPRFIVFLSNQSGRREKSRDFSKVSLSGANFCSPRPS